MLEAIRHLIETALIAVGALLPIVDPLGGAPIYLGMTANMSPADRLRCAKLVAINSFLLLLAAVLVGSYVLDFFGVSIPAVQVAGGLVVSAIGWSLLNSPATPSMTDRSTSASAETISERAFYPITMPLTVGPGAISAALTLGANPPRGLRPLLTTAAANSLGVLAVAISVYVCYRYADVILRKLGSTGTNALIRLMAFIVLCIGVQIMWNGVHALIVSLHGV